MNIEDIPDRIRDLRHFHNWSQRHLSKEIGVRQQTISDWEQGRALRHLKAIVRLLHLFREMGRTKGRPDRHRKGDEHPSKTTSRRP